MGFKEQFLSTPAGPQREALVYREALKMGPPKTKEITVPGPGGTTITYRVMPDFLTIDGIRVPMSAYTAQRIAKHFGMQLPTSKIVDQVWDAAKKSGTNIVARPLSGTGADFEGKHYTPEQVVNDVSKPEFSVAYNDVINNDPVYQQHKENEDAIFSGHMKEIIQPTSKGYSDRLHFRGLMDANGNPIQTGRSPHSAKNYSEYAAGARFVDQKVTVKTPDGKVIETTLDRVMRLPNISKAVSDTPNAKRYTSTSSLNEVSSKPGSKPSSGKTSIDGEPVGKATQKMGPPPGYISPKFTPEEQAEASAIATKLLHSDYPLWSLIPVTVKGKPYMVKIEPHGSKVPRGISMYKKIDSSSETESPKEEVTTPEITTEDKTQQIPNVSKRQGLWDRINNFLNQIGII